MVTEQRYAWGKFVAILAAMALLVRVSPALTQTESYPELDWQIYIACTLLLALAYYPLAGRLTEKLGRKQLWLMLGGLVLYAAVSWFTNIFRYPTISTITLRLGVVVPLLMGLGFGPAVGFVVGAAGNHLGDFFSGWGFFPMWNIGNGLMGFVAGLIHFVPAQYRPVPRLLAAELILLIMLGVGQWWGTADPFWLGVYGWLILVAAGAWWAHGRYPRATTAIAWGTAGVILGMSVAAVTELWTQALPLEVMLTQNLVIIIGANLLFTQTLLPALYSAWE
jgi:energy-coupling factor transport system substrate-specific component